MKKLLKRLFPDTHPLRITAHRIKNEMIAFLAGYPAKKLTVVGVTGSDGKTTTVGMITHILEQAGMKTAAVSTAYFSINGQREDNPTQKTSVDAKTLQTLLKRAVRAGCTHAVIEASSHGLVQGRLAGITPRVAVITNLSMEHLDYHGSMEEYMLAKSRLFRALKGTGTKVLNTDDRTYAAYSGIASTETRSYGEKSGEHNALHLTPTNIVVHDHAVDATLTTSAGETHQLHLQIPGSFNIENAMAALAATSALGIAITDGVQALQSFRGVAGRMEAVPGPQPFRVYVDFTVTPSAYEKTLSTLRASLNAEQKLLVLAGSCGDRMKEKRPLVGEICTRLADITIITNEDPYTEDPETIIDEVLSGVPSSVPILREVTDLPNSHVCLRISDRMQAIDTMLRLAKPGDALLFAGKGSDVTMMTKGGQIPWNEREILQKKLQRFAT